MDEYVGTIDTIKNPISKELDINKIKDIEDIKLILRLFGKVWLAIPEEQLEETKHLFKEIDNG